MGVLTEKVKLSLLKNGNGIAENFKNNSIYFYELYNKSIEEFNSIKTADIYPGGFYFIHYIDESNWMKYAPIFVADYKKFSNKIVLFAVNMNFIPLEVRILLFDKFITEKDIEEDKFLKVDLQGVYDQLRRLGFEYALMEFDTSRIKRTHKVSLSLLPRFLYHQHPINKYDPNKLIDIWEAKLQKREERHKEMTLAMINEFFDINSEISDKFNVLKSHITRLQRNIRKFN